MYSMKWRRILSLLLGVALSCSLGPAALASAEQPDGGYVVFSNLSALAPNESVQQVVIDSEGNEAVIGLRKIAPAGQGKDQARTAAAGETWQVWYRGINIYAEFYMDVSNNRVTSVYDSSINIFGGSYSDESLTKTATYGKFSFKITGIAGLTSSSCWLKGTVTGSDNEIEVTWSM